MSLTVVSEDSSYKCNACGNVLYMKKGQLLPPCPRCGGQMARAEGSAPPQGSSCCS